MNSLETIILAVTFAMTLVVTLQALDSMALFGPVGSKVVSVCVAFLSVIGLHQAMGTSIEILLIPYAVIGRVVSSSPATHMAAVTPSSHKVTVMCDFIVHHHVQLLR